MLQSLHILNFKIHKKLKIKFNKITTIVGSSFTGKSCIIRALRWLILNKPAGDSMRKWNTNKTFVRLTVDNNKIIRKRTNSKNLYKINDEVFSAFATDVPENVSKLLNISSVNFQGQQEAPFWFCETAGEVSRQLNAIVNLDIMDSTLANISSEQRKISSVVEVIEERLEALKEKKSRLLYVEELEGDLEQVEDLQKESQQIYNRLLILESITGQVCSYQKEQINLIDFVKEGVKVISVEKSYQTVQKQIENLQELLNKQKQFQRIMDNKPPSTKPLEELKKESEKLEKQRTSLYIIIEGIESWRKVKEDSLDQMKKMQNILEEKIGKICPLCGQDIKN